MRDGDGKAIAILNSIEVNLEELRRKVEILNPAAMENGQEMYEKKNLHLTRQAERALKTTFLEAKLFQSSVINTAHLLLCILRNENDPTTKIFNNMDINYNLVKDLFKEADESLGISLSKIILEGPKDELDLTVNTQPAIFLVGYAIFKLLTEEFNIKLNNAKYFAGHSLGEYTALACSGVLSFSDTLKILKLRGKAMQASVEDGEGSMVAVLGSDIKNIEKILYENNHHPSR